MSRRRPLLGAAAGLLAVALGLTLAPAAPAATQQSESCTPTESDTQDSLQFLPIDLHTSDPTPDAHQPIEFQVKNNASSFGPRAPMVQSITATLVACQDGQELPDPSTSSMTGGESTSMSMAWSADFTWNGVYALVVEAKGQRWQTTGYVPQSLRVVKQLHLAVPPKKPTGVKATTSNGVVTISWSNAGREPDLIAYEVRRTKQGSNDYVTVKDGLVRPTTSSVSDTPPEGAYRYQVIAYRPDVEAGAVSSDATAEVTAPATAGATTGAGTSGSTGTAGGTSSSAGGDGTSAGSGSTATTRPAITTGGAGGTVELSNFAAALNARRSTPTTRVEPPDPGYEETLPFHVAGDEPAVGSPDELGAGEDAGLGQRLVADPDARRRSLGFVAFGLILFVLAMTGLFVKGEVNRADELEALDDADADPEPDAGPVPAVPAAAAATSTPPMPERRNRRAPVAVRAMRTKATTEPLAASAEPVAEPVAVVRTKRARATAEPVAEPAVAVVRTKRARATAEPLAGSAEPVAEPAVAAGTALPDRPARRARRLPLMGPDPAELDEFTPPEANGAAHEDLRDVLGHPEPSEPTATNGSHRRRRTVAPLDAPGLDVPDPASTPATTRTRTTDARRAATRLPARPADDRRQGRAAVRAGGGGAGQGDRRVPVGR
jgi:hypothetical protein